MVVRRPLLRAPFSRPAALHGLRAARCFSGGELTLTPILTLTLPLPLILTLTLTLTRIRSYREQKVALIGKVSKLLIPQLLSKRFETCCTQVEGVRV